MAERRGFQRIPIITPVNISTVERRDRIGMIRDVSADGMLFHSRSRFAIGERVSVYFDVDANRHDISGRVVRASLDTNHDTLFQHLTAIRFEAPLATPLSS